MNKYVIELAKIFDQEDNYLNTSLPIFNKLFSHSKNKGLTIKILRELFLRPFLTSKALSEKLAIGKSELKEAYLFIRSSKVIRDLFKLASYPYLIEVLADLIKDKERTLKILKGETPTPLTKTMELFISGACNANCKFCYRNGGEYDEKNILSSREFTNLINEFADLKGETLDVCGGLEPLLGPSILDVLKVGVERKVKVNLYTNGIALNRKDLLYYLLKINKIRVSLNGYDRANYKDLTGVDEFNVVKNNLINLIKAKKNFNSEVKIGINFIVFKKNFKKIFDVIKLAKEIDVDFLDLRNIHVTGGGDFNAEQREKLKSILKEIKRGILSKQFGQLSISIADTFNFIIHKNGFLKDLKRAFVKDLINFRVTITPQGRVYALNVIAQPTREDPRYFLGKLNKESNLSSILRSKREIPFEPELLLPHDISIIGALSKLKSDLEFGIKLEESPFNFR